MTLRSYIAKLSFSLILSLLFISGFIFNPGTARAQDADNGKWDKTMQEGVSMMDTGNYEGADAKFKIVLRNMEVLPSDICYYFGKNSYFLGQFKQSINWLNKYIELKGTAGEFFEDCKNFLSKAEKAYELNEQVNQEKVKEELSKPNEFDCDGKTYITCPLCLGEGVLIKPGKLGTIYETCPICKGEGKITCTDYKKYLRGELTTNK